jgi:hypothetical protein
MYTVDEFFNLADCTADQYCLEIIAIAKPVTNTRSNGINILKDGRKLCPENIFGSGSFDITASQQFCHDVRFFLIMTTYSEVGQFLQSNFFGVTGPAHEAYVLIWNTQLFVKITGRD